MKKENKEIIVKDRILLEQRLKELSETKYRGIIRSGAMCYSPVEPSLEDYECPVCGYKTVQTNHTIWEIKCIRTMVAQIKDAGYDVILDEYEFCDRCSGNKKPPFVAKSIEWNGYRKTDAELIFKIRYNPESEYHIAKSNFAGAYECVLEFLKGNNSYSGGRAGTEPLNRKKNIEILQKMLGIGQNIVPRQTEDENY
jgi:hypothetical protein